MAVETTQVSRVLRSGLSFRPPWRFVGRMGAKCPEIGHTRRFLGKLATRLKTTQLLFMTDVMSRVAVHESSEKNGRKSGIHFNLRKNL